MLLAFILAFSFCPIAPSTALAKESGSGQDELTNAPGSALRGVTVGGSVLTPQSDDDSAAGSWEELQDAIRNVEQGFVG